MQIKKAKKSQQIFAAIAYLDEVRVLPKETNVDDVGAHHDLDASMCREGLTIWNYEVCDIFDQISISKQELCTDHQ